MVAVLRTIPFGYTVRFGKVEVHPTEARVVQQIFSLYIQGRTMKHIADDLIERKIVYFQNEVRWNKSTIKRIIENVNYIGDASYPMIVSADVFRVANEKRIEKAGEKAELSPIVAYFKEICVCGQCGTRYKRINTWGSKEKWMCASGCKTLRYIDDRCLGKAVLQATNTVITNPERLKTTTYSAYTPTKEVLREENELLRLLEQPRISFAAASKSILCGAALRFGCCEYDTGEMTAVLQEAVAAFPTTDELNLVFVKQFIRKIKIFPNGKLTVVFFNGAEIATIGGTDDGSCIAETDHKD